MILQRKDDGTSSGPELGVDNSRVLVKLYIIINEALGIHAPCLGNAPYTLVTESVVDRAQVARIF
jgi:hypothetical protein